MTTVRVAVSRRPAYEPSQRRLAWLPSVVSPPPVVFTGLPWMKHRQAEEPAQEPPRQSSVPWYYASAVSTSSAWRPIWHPQPQPLEDHPPTRAQVKAFLWAYPTFIRAPSRSYVSRVPDVRGRLRRFTDEVATLLDSLIAQNILLQLGPMAWTLRNVATQISGPPTASHDFPRGYRIGAVVIDTLTGDAYICTSSLSGAAVWKKIT